MHATQKGILGCDPKAFLRVSETDNSVLNRGLFARRIFSKEVQDLMLTNGDIKEAQLVKHICNWYDACNERGLTVRE